jgi:hypothetical protein
MKKAGWATFPMPLALLPTLEQDQVSGSTEVEDAK